MSERGLLHRQDGNVTIEYALMIAIIAIGSVAVLYTFSPVVLSLVYSWVCAVAGVWPQ